jgi:hypothetical protein
MHRLVTAIITALAFLSCCWGAWAIDCKHARLPAQQVACSSPELMKVLDERDRVFAQVRARLKGKELAALVADEREWVKNYPKSCGVPAKGTLPTPIAKETIACFKRASEERITYLRQYGQPKAAAAPMPASPAAPSENTASPSPAAPPSAAAPKAVEESALPPAGQAAPSPVPAPENAATPEHAAPPPEPQPPAAEKSAPPAVAAVPPGPATAPPGSATALPGSATTPPGSATAPPSAAGAPASSAAAPAAPGEYHLKFTFACSNAGELPKVMSSLAANDLAYPLSRPDCLPVPDGGKASLLSVNGDIAKIRMCTADVGCTDVYIDANAVLDAEGHPVAK